MEESKKTKLFLLGGYDLEMVTIAELLKDRPDVVVEDKKLSWGAKLSDYADELKKYADEDKYEIYGIELNEDIEIPKNYHRIDHHNELCGNPSSLEQVADVFNHKLTRHEQLVAQNDANYIEGMKAIQATDNEIKEIRFADRKAQGVTDEEEKNCLEAIYNDKKERGGVTLVQSPIHRFSPIVDYLYDAPKLLVYCDDEMCYYSKDEKEVEQLVSVFKDEIKKGVMYNGKGYIGVGRGHKNHQEIKAIMNIITHYAYSKHVFIFPFRWFVNNSKSNLDFLNSSYWDKISSKSWRRSSDDPVIMYTEKQYFFKHTHSGMYDDVKSNLLHHFERVETSSKPVKYRIKIESKEYVLDVESLNINLYYTGVGTVLLHCSNYQYGEFDDVCNINQYGRRHIPQSASYFGDTATKIELTGLDGLTLSQVFNKEDLQEKLKQTKSEELRHSLLCRSIFKLVRLICPRMKKEQKEDYTWRAGSIMTSLVQSLCPQMEIAPIVDDRMFVLCSLGCDDLAEKIKTGCDFQNKWYQYVFVDKPGDCSCQNDEMKTKLLHDATYTRWQKCGTLYGISKYSFVALSDKEFANHPENGLHRHCTTLYARMYELCIIQLASVLNFNSMIAELSKKKNPSANKLSKEVESLYQLYIKFENSLAHIAVTDQDQGIELYDLMRLQMRIREFVQQTDEMLHELHEYSSSVLERERNKTTSILTVAATLFLLPSLIASFGGINSEIMCPWHWVVLAMIALLIGVVVWIIFYFWKIRR